MGTSWEGWVFEQIINRLQITDHPLEATHFGTSDRHDLPQLLEYPKKRCAIDITISSHPKSDMLVRLGSLAKLVGADHAILVNRTTAALEHDGLFPWIYTIHGNAPCVNFETKRTGIR